MYLYGYDPEFAALLAGDDGDMPEGTARGARFFATVLGLVYVAAAVAVIVFL